MDYAIGFVFGLLASIPTVLLISIQTKKRRPPTRPRVKEVPRTVWGLSEEAERQQASRSQEGRCE